MRRLLLALAVLVAMAAAPGGSFAQERGSVTGQVIASDTEQPVWGVLIEIPSLNLNTITDERGRFLFASVPYGQVTIRASVLGYRMAEQLVTVGSTPATLNLTLEPDPLLLDELVVTGYGTERRANVAGAVSSLRTEAVAELPITSVNQALQGRLAGVQINQNSGTPGGAATIRVRGSSSISGGNDPL